MRLRLIVVVVAVAVIAVTGARGGSVGERFLVIASVPPAAKGCPWCSVALVYDSHGRLLRTVRAARYASLSWSPDGNLLAVVTKDGVSVERADGSGSRQLVTIQTKCTTNCLSRPLVVWSPDSQRLVIGGVDPKTTGFVLVNVASGQVKTLRSPTPNVGCLPLGFSPDGSRLAYGCGGLKPGAPPWALIVARANGALARVVLHFAGTASWSPDSSRIALTDDGHNGEPRLAIVDVRSGKLHALDPHNVYDQRPAWSPNGARLALARFQGPAFTMAANGTSFRSLGANGIFTVWLQNGDLLLAQGPHGHSIVLFQHGHAPGRMLFRLPGRDEADSIQEARY